MKILRIITLKMIIIRCNERFRDEMALQSPVGVLESKMTRTLLQGEIVKERLIQNRLP